jgi:hypothetical protein
MMNDDDDDDDDRHTEQSHTHTHTQHRRSMEYVVTVVLPKSKIGDVHF